VSISIYYGGVRKFVALAFASVGLAAGCGSSDNGATTRSEQALNQSAARFVVRTQANLRLGKFERAWRSLHPAEKRVISAKRLASCYPRNEFPETVTFRATQTEDVDWLVPGTRESVEAKEVTVTARSPGQKPDTFTQHVVRLGGQWKWMLSETFFDKAKRGAC
jgi:hypothetical protein